MLVLFSVMIDYCKYSQGGHNVLQLTCESFSCMEQSSNTECAEPAGDQNVSSDSTNVVGVNNS